MIGDDCKSLVFGMMNCLGNQMSCQVGQSVQLFQLQMEEGGNHLLPWKLLMQLYGSKSA